MDPIPEDVRQFLEANVDSLQQLETLRVLGDDVAREWSAEEMSQQIQSTAELTVKHFTTLEARGLARCVRSEGRVRCVYGPHSPALDVQLRRLLELYQQRPVTMIRMVYERQANALRDFSDAFKLRREP